MKLQFLPKTILLLVITAFTFVSCKKDPPPTEPIDQLPPLTHEGKNTFGCLIDGEPFVAKVDYSFGGPSSMSGFFNEETFDFGLSGAREEPSNYFETVYIYAYLNNNLGDYLIDITHDKQFGFRVVSSSAGDQCDYYHDANNPGALKITNLNTVENIVSGTFFFTLKNLDCTNDTIMKISNGRFDFRY